MLSGGRLTVVAGTGYLRSEFLALNVDMSARNELFDESLEVLRGVWNEVPFAYQGKHFTARGVASLPAPAQPGGPPVLIGGNSALARARAARNQGWSPLMVSPEVARTSRTPGIATVAELAAQIREVRDAAASGRIDAALTIQVHTPQAGLHAAARIGRGAPRPPRPARRRRSGLVRPAPARRRPRPHGRGPAPVRGHLPQRLTRMTERRQRHGRQQRVAVVTGGSRGVGRGIAIALGSHGYTVYVTGRTHDGRSPWGGTIHDTAAAVTAAGGKGVAVRVDHRNDDEVEALFERVRAGARAVSTFSSTTRP